MAASAVLDKVLRQIAEQPERLVATLEESAESLIAFDRSRRILGASEAAERFLGHERGALLMQTLDVLIPARFRQPDAPPPAATSDLTTVEVPALRRDGTEVMTVWSYAAVGGPEDTIFLLTMRARSSVIAELEASTYAAIFENSPVPVALSRATDAVMVEMNHAFCELFEVRREDFIGRASTELGIATTEQRAEIARLLTETGSLRELEVARQTTTGKRLFLSLSVTRVQIGGVTHLMSTVQDISRRKEQEEANARVNAELKKTASALQESRARADYAVLLSGIGFWYCDLPFDELNWDARVKRHFFLPADARVTIDTFYERLLPEDRERTRAAIDASIRDHSVYDVVYRTSDPTRGDVKWIRAMGGTSYAADGTPVRFDGVTVDISNQKRDEARLASVAAQAEDASRAKDEFLAMLGHELRNPLAPISTAVHLMKLRGSGNTDREIAVIDRQTRYIGRLVDDLLDVSRIARGKVALNKDTTEVADIVAAAIETATPAIEGGRHNLVVDVPRRGLVVDVDRGRMTQVLANLLANAAKYTPPGGQIRVKGEAEENEIVISVEDSGIGIPADLLPQVFDLFVQGRQPLDRAQGGLGLGLALVKNLVVMHGGSVSATSDGIGRGSTFTVRLPAIHALPPKQETSRPAVDESATAGLQRVLIVDDNVDAAEMLATALGMMGYQTSVAHDGMDALRLAADVSPHFALLDIGLPIMDGYELARKLRAEWPELKLVAITGYGQESDRQRTREAGFHAHLTKPVDLQGLADVLRNLTGTSAH